MPRDPLWRRTGGCTVVGRRRRRGWPSGKAGGRRRQAAVRSDPRSDLGPPSSHVIGKRLRIPPLDHDLTIVFNHRSLAKDSFSLHLREYLPASPRPSSMDSDRWINPKGWSWPLPHLSVTEPDRDWGYAEPDPRERSAKKPSQPAASEPATWTPDHHPFLIGQSRIIQVSIYFKNRFLAIPEVK